MTEIKLVIGLGNPGSQYHDNRHNAGFWLLDQLACNERKEFRLETKFHASVAKLNDEVFLAKPSTFMNRSGQAAGAVARFYKIEPAQILVVHDELDLPPGAARLKKGGGLGGHNGLKDIAAHLGTQDFWRLRLGIGHPGDKSQVADYVLKAPRKEEYELILDAINKSLIVWPQIVEGKLEAAMLKLHSK